MDQGITVFHKNESLQMKQREAAINKKPKKGPLNVKEQLALISICQQQIRYNEISAVSCSKFWTGIEVALEKEIGRRYSHFSCRKRINEYIAHRALCQMNINNGVKTDPAYLPDPEVRKLLDRWEEMDKFKEQLEKEKALGQLVGRDPEVPTKNKLQRVADWVKSLPDPEPQPLVTPPSTNSSQSPVKQDESSALWARYQKIEDYRAIARTNQLRALNNDLVSSRQLLSNIKEQLTSALPASRALPALPVAGFKRFREDEVSPDRAAPRPRTELTDPESMIKPVVKQSPGNSNVIPGSDIPAAQNPLETVFGKFWDSMLPYFKERALKDGLCLTKSESIMHDMFKEVGAAMTRAFMKLEQTSRAPPAHKPLI
ncbi:uncharacterized protein DSM5745_08264 [Aspergillus mulundensis]|uniref:Uncharacterized protein n=1 Tax=Aspergillus mulundensis TaxID=1810919 RepID=A0A3D8R9L2_9EURO|nr:Uncharacterized protein DSM5745_08264 [Aspergillus mulundensis]RDW70753.1 Uncharacterized protein DSM5745_08264 [Aspergillus mulundensis]